MNDKQIEQREVGLNRSCGFCEVCGKSLEGTQIQGAHIIGQTETNYNLYGSFFIDSVANIKITCSLGCNAKADIGKSQGAVLKQLAKILTYEINKFKEGK